MYTLVSDILQFGISSFLSKHDIVNMSKTTKYNYVIFNDNVIWEKIEDDNGLLYPSKKRHSVEFFKNYMRTHYVLDSNSKFAAVESFDKWMCIKNWQMDDNLLRVVSRTYKMHPDFFHHLSLNLIEGLFLGSICRRHQLYRKDEHMSSRYRYNLICDSYLSDEDITDIKCLCEIQMYVENINKKANIIFASIHPHMSYNEYEPYLCFLRKLNSRDYISILECLTT